MKERVVIAICSVVLGFQAAAAELEGASLRVRGGHTNAGSRAWLEPASGSSSGIGSAGATLGFASGASVGPSYEVASGFWPGRSASPSSAPEACLGDIDGDGVVGGPDYALFGRAFGSSEGEAAFDPGADLDDNGVVGGSDYLLFGVAFGSSCSSD